MDPPDDLITPREAARILRVSVATIRTWYTAGGLRSWKIGPTGYYVRVSEGDVRALIVEQPSCPDLGIETRREAAVRRCHTQKVLEEAGIG